MRASAFHPEPRAAGGSSESPEEGRVGVVVVTHGCVCGDLVAAAESIVGAFAGILGVSTDPHEPAEVIQRRVLEAVTACDQGRGVLVLTDLCGSTPANACLAAQQQRLVEVLYGVNLPMLIKLSTIDRRNVGPRELAELLMETGRRSIRLASEQSGPHAKQP